MPERATGRRPRLAPGLPEQQVPSLAPVVGALLWTLGAIHIFRILQP
jgi:hypothetical protein